MRARVDATVRAFRQSNNRRLYRSPTGTGDNHAHDSRAHPRVGRDLQQPRIRPGTTCNTTRDFVFRCGFSEPGKYRPGIIAGGLGIDYYSWDWDPLGNAGYSYSVIPIQVFSNYHFVIESNKKIDPYAGLAFVYSIVNASWKGSGVEVQADGSYSDIAGQAGVRYFVTPKLALQGQIGFGYGTLGIGATWKF